jgi:hypothetical protein
MSVRGDIGVSLVLIVVLIRSPWAAERRWQLFAIGDRDFT